MTIIILYVVLVISTCALLCVGIAMYLRVRRLARASETQFCRALKDDAAEHLATHQQEHNTTTVSASNVRR